MASTGRTTFTKASGSVSRAPSHRPPELNGSSSTGSLQTRTGRLLPAIRASCQGNSTGACRTSRVGWAGTYAVLGIVWASTEGSRLEASNGFVFRVEHRDVFCQLRRREQVPQVCRDAAEHEPAASIPRIIESTHDLAEAIAVHRPHLAEIDDDVDAPLVDQPFNRA